MHKYNKSSLIRLLAGMLGVLLPLVGFAQPLNITQTPLLSSTNVKPNLLFLIDDSGSMDWEVATQDAANDGRFTNTQPNGKDATGAGSVKQRDANDNGTADCGFGSGSFYGYMYIVEFASNTYTDNGNDCNTADDEAWRIRNHNFNSLYYNPATTYTPWAGVDANGNAFIDIDPTNAPNDPFNPTEHIDLTRNNSNYAGNDKRATSDRDGDGKPDGFRYYTWEDKDNDGNFDNGEETEVQIKNLPLKGTVSSPNSQTNFANWFAYYRSRDLLAKNAYGKVIAGSDDTRMGMVTLHNNNVVNTPIQDMNANPVTGDKRQLLDALYRFGPDGGTPLRKAMFQCGQYLSCADNPFNFGEPCPALSANKGGSCQQNFLITMTDGFYNGSYSGTGNTDQDGSGKFDGGAYADSYSNTLADIAMRYYEDDIHPDLDDDLRTSDADPAPHQHIVAYTVAFGVNGTLDASPTDPKVPFAWPDPTKSATAKIDDLRHAAYNGRGLFLDASDPTKLENSLKTAISDIETRQGSASALSINTGTISTNSRLYQASFVGNDWTGELVSRQISDGSNNGNCTASNDVGAICAPEWSAAKQLDTQNWNSGREIITRINDQAVSFRNKNIPKSLKQEIPSALLQFLRGRRNLEQSKAGDNATITFRDRKTVLGDIVNSSPVFVGAPDRVRYPVTWTDALNGGENGQEATAGAYRNPTAGSDFVRANSGRTPMVYVGANDGMLHAFDSATGKERLAYIPEAVIGKLGKLGDLNYNHEFYVDGNPIVGDAVINSGGSPKWRSVLVSGLRAGGRSVFALDVTNPANFDEANAADIELWEFTDSDLGLTYSEPSIVRLHNGKWAAIFGNGYNSASQSAVFYVVDLSTGALLAKLDTGATPGNGNPAFANGLASVFPVDLDGDFITDYVYAGDLYGNLWKFDLTSADPSKWKIGFGTKSAPESLFTACEANPCTATNRQPITAKPQVGAHPYGLDYGVMVYFGTGKYLEKGDSAPDTDTQHSFYGIWDGDVFSATDSPPFATSVTHGFTRSRLTSQSILTSVDKNGQTFRVLSNNLVQYQQADDNDSATTDGANKRGWVLNLPSGSGEMVVTDATLRGKIVAFSTLIPSETPCEVGGSGFFMVVDAATGGRTDFSALDVNGDRMFNSDDKVSVNDKNVTTSGVKIDGGAPGRAGFAIARKLGLDIAIIPVSNASISAIDVNVGLLPQGRRTWQELRR